MSFELHDSFRAPDRLLEDQVDRQDNLRSAAFLFARAIEANTRDQDGGSGAYREESLRLARSAMLAALESVAVERTGVPRRAARKKNAVAP